MIRRIICKVLRFVWRRSPTLRTQSPLTSNSRATSFRNDPSRCRTYSGSANRRRCAFRKSSERIAIRRAFTRAKRRENPSRRLVATQWTGSTADLVSMIRTPKTHYSIMRYKTRSFTQLANARQSTTELERAQSSNPDRTITLCDSSGSVVCLPPPACAGR